MDPRNITQWVVGITGVAGATWRMVGRVEGGDWDRNLQRFEERGSFRAFYSHFVEGTPWKDTNYYAFHLPHIAKGHVRWGCLNREDFDRRCAAIDALYESIRLGGYKLQRELLKESGKDLSFAQRRQVLDEVVICVGRNGELLFADGQHRLSIAKIIGVPKIPVRVLVRHAEWQALRTRIARRAAEDYAGTLPHALPHPDMSFVETVHDSGQWAELLATLMTPGDGRLIEVSAGISGFFSDFFEQRGWVCDAWEDDLRRRELLRRIRSINHRTFEIVDSTAVHAMEDGAFDAAVWITDIVPSELPHAVVQEVARVTGGELFLAVPGRADSKRTHRFGEYMVNQFRFAGYEVHTGPVGERERPCCLLKLFRHPQSVSMHALLYSEAAHESTAAEHVGSSD